MTNRAVAASTSVLTGTSSPCSASLIRARTSMGARSSNDPTDWISSSRPLLVIGEQLAVYHDCQRGATARKESTVAVGAPRPAGARQPPSAPAAARPASRRPQPR